MRIWHISDVHSHQLQLTIPPNIDIVICSGDMSDHSSTANKNWYNNEPEVRDFIQWFKELPIEHKIFVAGNHDTSIESRFITKKDFKNRGIIYLEHESIEIEGIKIFGSPYTPEFHNWAFNRTRAKLGKFWDSIPDDTDILITHGPPKGILDSAPRDKNLNENVGCSALLKKVLKVKPKYMIFGHIHDNGDNLNNGTFKLNEYRTIFAKVSCVKDADKLPFVHNGYSFDYL